MVRVPRLAFALASALLALPLAALPVEAQFSGPSPLAPAYDQLEPVCQQVNDRDPMRDPGDEHPDSPPGGAWDEFRNHSACYQMRNDLQNEAYGGDLPSYWGCSPVVAGRKVCFVVNDNWCDVGFALPSGMGSLCVGMLLPDH